jgi:hypothetical protein
LEAADIKGLLGLLLVDGSLNQYRTPRGGYVQLTLTGGVTESEFLSEKVAEFRQFIPTEADIVPYQTAARYSKRPNAAGEIDGKPRHTTVLRFRVSTNKLRPVYNLLYPDGTREITQNVLDMLGGKAAAWTWAEGGRLHKDGTSELARCGTTSSEALRISKWLAVLTGAQGEIDEFLVKPRLSFSAEDTSKLKRILLPYAPASRKHLFDEHAIHQNSSGMVSRQREDIDAGKQAAVVA